MKRRNILDFVLGAMFLALGLVLPFLTGQIPQIGSMLLPMHIPVILCGLICGAKYGVTVGFVLPLMRSALFSMPPLYPTAIAMALELATYGFLAGFLFEKARWKCIKSLYRCLVVAMVGGRIVWGVAMAVLLGSGNSGFTFSAFITGAVLNAIPGIILQLILIPVIMFALNKTHFVKFLTPKQKTDGVAVNENG